jgi:hypothetical protein
MPEGVGRDPATHATVAHAPHIERMGDFDHSHIAPADYLRSWPDGKQLAMRVVEDLERAVPIAPKDAGVRLSLHNSPKIATAWTSIQGAGAAAQAAGGLAVEPEDVVHPVLLGGWRCQSPSTKEKTG